MGNIKQVTLNNGLEFYHYSSPGYATSTAIFEIRAGSFMEDRKINGGWSHILEHMMFKASGKYTTRERMELLKENGAFYNAFTDGECITFFFQCPNHNFEKVYDIFIDLLFNPLFDKKELDVEKKVVIAELKQRSIIDKSRCYNMVMENGYGKEAGKSFFGNRTIGTIETIKRCNSKDLRDMYEKYFDPRNIKVVVVNSSENYEKYVKKIADLDLQKHEYDIVFRVNERIKIANKLVLNRGYSVATVKERKSVMFWMWTPGPTSKDYRQDSFNLNIVNLYKSYLGDISSSLLWNKLREEKGYIYSLGFDLDIDPFHSKYYATFEVNDLMIEPFLQDFYKIMDEFAQTGITKKEIKKLALAKKNENAFVAHDSMHRAHDILFMTKYGMPVLTSKDFLKRYDLVTPEHIMEHHKKYWCDKQKSYITAMTSDKKVKDLKKALNKYFIL